MKVVVTVNTCTYAVFLAPCSAAEVLIASHDRESILHPKPNFGGMGLLSRERRVGVATPDNVEL